MLSKQSIEFIKDVVDREEKILKAWLEESIMQNSFGKNLFLVFPDKEKVTEYLIHCSENKLYP